MTSLHYSQMNSLFISNVSQTHFNCRTISEWPAEISNKNLRGEEENMDKLPITEKSWLVRTVLFNLYQKFWFFISLSPIGHKYTRKYCSFTGILRLLQQVIAPVTIPICSFYTAMPSQNYIVLNLLHTLVGFRPTRFFQILEPNVAWGFRAYSNSNLSMVIHVVKEL